MSDKYFMLECCQDSNWDMLRDYQWNIPYNYSQYCTIDSNRLIYRDSIPWSNQCKASDSEAGKCCIQGNSQRYYLRMSLPALRDSLLMSSKRWEKCIVMLMCKKSNKGDREDSCYYLRKTRQNTVGTKKGKFGCRWCMIDCYCKDCNTHCCLSNSKQHKNRRKCC